MTTARVTGRPFPVVVHHNPACGTSRNVVAIATAAGYAPAIIPYLETGWTRAQLLALFAAAGVTPREALRAKEKLAVEHGLLGASVSDNAILDAMIAHPVLVERPFVATPKGVRLCRPAALVLDLLERDPPGPFTLGDGSLLIDASGNRVGA